MDEEQRANKKHRPNAKHVSRACLECRHRHIKCDGKEPKCTRCVQLEKTCEYVKSHRGGSRKKGVSKFSVRAKAGAPGPGTAGGVGVGGNASGNASGNAGGSTQQPGASGPGQTPALDLPCMRAPVKQEPGSPVKQEPGSLAHTSCPNGHTSSTCGFLLNGDLSSLPCGKHRAALGTDGKHSDPCTAKTDSKLSIEAFSGLRDSTFKEITFDQLNIPEIIHNYYGSIHSSHPVLPPANEIDAFLQKTGSPMELLLVMKLFGEGYTSQKYSKNIDQILSVSTQVLSIIDSKPSHQKDIITLQTLILLSLVCHISALHDMGAIIRSQIHDLIRALDLNNLDMDFYKGLDINGNKSPQTSSNYHSTPESFNEELNMNFYNTPRIRALDEHSLKECARRCFWEFFFMDIIISCSDGKTTSKLTEITCFVNYPSTPTKFQFDYETRSLTSKLVDDSVRFNNLIFTNKPIKQQYSQLTAALSNWDLKFSNPELHGIGLLINNNGDVNDGIYQGLIMFNYAKIFTHRPLSYLWRSDIPKTAKCVELLIDEFNDQQDENCDSLPVNKELINSRKIIETRKTIEAANLITNTLIDTNPANILKRTPLSACSLAFAGLIHISAYLWSIQVLDNESSDLAQTISSQDLKTYEELIKLEISSVYTISNHWYLSSRLVTHLIDSIKKLVPDLYDALKPHINHFAKLNSQTSLSLVENHSNSSAYSVDQFNQFIPISSVDSMSTNSPPDSLPLVAMSPQSDTGCDYVDKLGLDFEFTNLNFMNEEFDLDALQSLS